MTRRRDSIPDTYFEALYHGDPDPWRFATSAYERDKYARTLDILGPARIGSGLEVGCSIGIFTRLLAARCERLLAVDVADRALAQARERCAGLEQLRFERLRIPCDWPAGHFDAVILSEVLYYLTPDDILRTAQHVGATLAPAGRVVLVHWTGLTDYPCTGDAAAEIFIRALAAAVPLHQSERHSAYRIDLLQR